MARNKYPEETVKKILDAALKLFLEKGYEQTTILDIVNETGGLTRGAFYHHFKSKEEVMAALDDKLFYDIDPFGKVKKLTSLNGIEKLRWVLSTMISDKDNHLLEEQAIRLLRSPTFLKKLIDENRDILTPMIMEIIEEGIQDGSIKVENPKFAAELFVIMLNFWIIPTIYPCTDEEAWQKFSMIKDVSTCIGLPVFDDELIEKYKHNAIASE